MSEFSFVEIVSTSLRNLCSTSSRLKVMSREIEKSYRELELLTKGFQKDRNIHTESNHILSDLKNIQPLTATNQQSNKKMKMQKEAKKFVATVKSLSSPLLKPLVQSSNSNFISTKSLANEVNHVLRTNNLQALEMKWQEINSTFRSLVDTIRQTHNVMAKQEQITTNKILNNSLKEIGYSSIRQIRKEGQIILRAHNKKTSIFARMNLNGTMEIDTAGFHGRDCEKTIDLLLKKLKDKGITVQRKERILHGKAEGGELVKEVKPLFNPLIENSEISAEENKREREIKKIFTVLENRQRIKCH